ncbi:neocarzinostatin apoprotein domain-containing protein [Streptomyces sp. XD-27]|uniref:neocarzinostatin apoprotein domain-containing protein n=1 Tax=Streptomyces sp. XD-27 TaxID=3062779 RepID=UPI0026F42F4C|nr:neocarzinostatin apoprotein domain-containing protein [Streptomyces sp. XD-27]WKX74250.1 neocarzinostatin apoprotein domain-containing protein [Streptomyces sp. XD-27]
MSSARADEGPTAEVSVPEAGAGGTVTVRGSGWRPGALLTLLICGQNMIGGTNSCANAHGRAVTTDADGSFSRRLPVADPPKPCPCVVHVATATGEPTSADAPFKVAGHPVAPLPEDSGGERLSVLSARLDGSSGPLTWFGAPPRRKLVVTVGNLGSSPARNPLFQIGVSHGVLAPEWADQRWRGTIPAGRKVQVKLDVELSAGAHGDYRISLRYGKKTLVEQPWSVGRPWGVTLFWVLLCVVVPAAVFRIGMAVVDRVRPRTAAGSARTTPDAPPAPLAPPAPPAPPETRQSAPSDDRTTRKGTT